MVRYIQLNAEMAFQSNEKNPTEIDSKGKHSREINFKI